MALPFLGPLLATLGTVGKGLGTAALAGGKGLWSLGKFIPSAAKGLLGGGRQVATVMGKPVTYGMTKQGANWLQYIPKALDLMSRLGLGGRIQAQQPTTTAGFEQEPYIPPQITRTGFPSYTMPSILPQSPAFKKAMREAIRKQARGIYF